MVTADQNLISRWEAKAKACQKQRSKYEMQWHLNMAFYFGRQYVSVQSKAVNSAGYALIEPRVGDPWRVRAVRNKIKRAVRNEMTKLTKEEPQGYVVPASTEDEDRLAAIAAEAMAEYFVGSSNFKAKRFQSTFWAALCGSGFLKTYYDPILATQDGEKGTVTYDAASAFHILVPFLQLVAIEEQPYVFHCRTLDADLVSGYYGKDIPVNTDPSTSVLDQRFFRSLGMELPKDEALKQCYVKEVWVKPCKEFPEGAMFIYSDKTLIHMNEQAPMQEGDLADESQLTLPTFERPGLPEPNPAIYPYEHGRFPFQKIDHIPTGMFYAESTIKDLIPVQKDYNRLRSQIMEFRNLATNPQWWMKKGAFNPREFIPKPGLVLQVNPGFEGPQRVEQPELPQQTTVEIDLNNREFDDISGQFEISKGRTPPGVEAASAIAFLQEENDTILYHTVASLEAAVQESICQTIDLVRQNWEEDRIVRTVSRNNTLEATLFKAGNFKANMDYRVVPDSMAPRSRAAKQAVISDLIKNGIIPPEKGLRYMYMSETNKLYEDMQVDIRQAERENIYMAQGKKLLRENGVAPSDLMNPMSTVQATYKQSPVLDPQTGGPMIDPSTGGPLMREQTVNEFDNHEVHIEEHSRYMKTQQYEVLQYDIKKIFEDHLAEHKEELAAEMGAFDQPQQLPQEELGQPNANGS